MRGAAVVAATFLIAWGDCAGAPPAPKRLTLVCSLCDEPAVVKLRDSVAQQLAKVGIVAGKDVEIVYRFRHTDVPSETELSGLIQEALDTKPDVLYPIDVYAAVAAKRWARQVPTLFSVFDPLGLGLVSDLGRPGGNMTGSGWSSGDLDAKRLQLLHELLPRARRIGVLTQGNHPVFAGRFGILKHAGTALKLELHEYAAASDKTVPADAQKLFTRMVADGMEAYLLADGNAWDENLLKLAHHYRLPSVHPYPRMALHAEFAAVAAYASRPTADGTNLTARYLADLLRGRKPADMPVQMPSGFEFIVNLKAARQAGLVVPQSWLLTATRIIE